VEKFPSNQSCLANICIFLDNENPKIIIMKKVFALLLLSISLMAFSTAHATALEDLLMSKMGIENKQASAGVGIILNYLKGKLSKDDYKTVSEDIGDESYYMQAANEAGAFKENKTLSSMGRSASKVKASGLLGETAPYFKNIGLKSDKIGGFFNTIVGYLKSKGSEKAVDILSKVKI
jgi:hypothetical protein